MSRGEPHVTLGKCSRLLRGSLAVLLGGQSSIEKVGLGKTSLPPSLAIGPGERYPGHRTFISGVEGKCGLQKGLCNVNRVISMFEIPVSSGF
jgi:hypothetical protein